MREKKKERDRRRERERASTKKDKLIIHIWKESTTIQSTRTDLRYIEAGYLKTNEKPCERSHNSLGDHSSKNLNVEFSKMLIYSILDTQHTLIIHSKNEDSIKHISQYDLRGSLEILIM